LKVTYTDDAIADIVDAITYLKERNITFGSTTSAVPMNS